MSRASVFAALLLCPMAILAQAATPPPSLAIPPISQDLQDGRPAQLPVKVVAPDGGTLAVTVPPGFQVQPALQDISKSSSEQTVILNLTPPPKSTVVKSGFIRIELKHVETGKPSTLLAEKTFALTYELGQSLALYFFLGLLGIAIGYLLRRVIKILSSLPVPPEIIARAVAAEPAPPTGLGRFIEENYYLVDGLVTAVLGFLILTSLVKDGRPPENGLFWYGAVPLGVGIGLLTNSELVTQIKFKGGAARLAQARQEAAERAASPAIAEPDPQAHTVV